MQSKKIIVYLCNAIEDTTKDIRAITTDSYAATNKVYGIAASMNEVGLYCIILSLGRGRQNGSGKFYPATIKRFRRISFLYCHFFNLPFFTHLITSISALFLMVFLIIRNSNLSVLVYNRTYHYIPALFIARLLRIKIFLDLEDGNSSQNKGLLYLINYNILRLIFNFLCPSGALIANTFLAKELPQITPFVCYGAIKKFEDPKKNWDAPCLRILFGGTLLREVGCLLLLEAIEILRLSYPLLFRNIHFTVTGKGEYSNQFREFSLRYPNWLSFNEALPSEKYQEILKSSHIGLSLRLSNFQMSRTTFPSKVIEYSQNGLLVITTRMEDITYLFGDNVLYLENETPLELAKLVESLSFRGSELKKIAYRGSVNVAEKCNYEVVGNKINSMLTNKLSS